MPLANVRVFHDKLIMHKEQLIDLFRRLAEIDPTTEIDTGMSGKLNRREIKAAPYSQQTLFSSMAIGAIGLFDDYPVPLSRKSDRQPSALVQTALRRTNRQHKFAVRCGPSGSCKYLSGSELMRRWSTGKAMVSVTDLHIRNSSIESLIDPTNLSWFNLLPDCDDAATQEMMSLVVSSAGCVSDSHSDAPDSSNYCFQGRKLWLMWDTDEGKRVGLDDCSIDLVEDCCSFDMSRFLQMRSSRWLTVNTGQALFLPGNYTHKVITLEKYLGVGSFYVSLPNSLRTISRWISDGPLWSAGAANTRSSADDELVVEIARHAKQKIKTLHSRSSRFKQKLGYDFLPLAFHTWREAMPKRKRGELNQRRYFADLVAQLDSLSG